ncbi:sensor histidine kinase [Natronospirillum operosum]|nr:sensor histidine kinase [Natronospirillum operosum]
MSYRYTHYDPTRRVSAHQPSSLRSVLLVQVALPVLLLMGGVLAITLNVVAHFTEERLQRNLQILAQAISLPVSEAMERGDLEQAENSLRSVFGISEVYGAYLFNAEGEQIISLGSVHPTRRQADEALRQTEEGEFAQYESIDGRNVYSYFMPLFRTAGQPNGFLQVTRRRSDIDNQLLQLRNWSWTGFGLLALLILGTITLAHQRSIGQPLDRLLSSMQKVQEGDRAHRADIKGPKEVRQLAGGLNGMLDAIQLAELRAVRQREERAQMAEKLRQAETLAALGQLAAGVAHELGAPLSVVDGRARRLQRRLDQPEDNQELEDIRTQAARMTSIIEQLLSYGRRSRAQQRPLCLAALTQRACALVGDETSDDRVTVVSGPECKIKGDSLSLEQALVNLLRNALQADPAGQIRIGWQLEESANGSVDQVTVTVEDAGPGIPPEQADQLFEPFYTTKAPGEGSGLGLAIVKRVLREHQGSIKIDRSPGLGGARFSLTFPLLTADAQGEPSA